MTSIIYTHVSIRIAGAIVAVGAIVISQKSSHERNSNEYYILLNRAIVLKLLVTSEFTKHFVSMLTRHPITRECSVAV